jgi:hypothetical protein
MRAQIFREGNRANLRRAGAVGWLARKDSNTERLSGASRSFSARGQVCVCGGDGPIIVGPDARVTLCSRPSRPLRAASRWAFGPALTAAARSVVDLSGRDEETPLSAEPRNQTFYPLPRDQAGCASAFRTSRALAFRRTSSLWASAMRTTRGGFPAARSLSPKALKSASWRRTSPATT